VVSWAKGAGVDYKLLVYLSQHRFSARDVVVTRLMALRDPKNLIRTAVEERRCGLWR
jgi:hypothetical protein